MPFDLAAYGPEVARILALSGAGGRLMPLAQGVCCSNAARDILKKVQAKALFAGARSPEAALSGLWLYFSCLDESHSVSQNIDGPDGSFWHGIMHRQEPDPGNAGYWFRRTGEHPVFPALRQAASVITTGYPDSGFRLAPRWDPFAFIDFVEAARRRPGTPTEQAALEIQRAEWQLLFDYCATPPSS